MSGGRRKSRKPQKWEDYVADEEQLANIEEELEKEEKARMLSAEEDSPKQVEEKVEAVEEEAETVEEEGEPEEEESEDEIQLEIVMQKEEEEDLLQSEEEVSMKVEELQEETDVVDALGVVSSPTTAPKSLLRPLAPAPAGASSKMVGECRACGIQLRDWTSAHSHLRFHRLSHVPSCITLPEQHVIFKVSCHVCQRTCQTREVLAYHAYTEHFPAPPRHGPHRPACPFCATTFPSTPDLHRHLDFDIITFKCQVCGESVNQENKFYQHMAECTRQNQPDLDTILCSVCRVTVKAENLNHHLLQHSTLLNLAKHHSSTNKRKRPHPLPEEVPRNKQKQKKQLQAVQQQQQQQQQPQCSISFRPFLCELCDHKFVVYSEFKRHLYSHSKSRAYVCTHCGRGYCQKNTLIVHLYTYHNAAPNTDEVTPQEDIAQRCCEGCGRAGFTSLDLLIRHHILRCSKRTYLQTSFAVIVNTIGKKEGLGFVEVMYSEGLRTYLTLAAQAWPSPPCVRDLLERLQEDPPPQLPPHQGRREASEFTDIQLLTYLELFEDKELDFLLNLPAKDLSSHLGEEAMSPEDSPGHESNDPLPEEVMTIPGSPIPAIPGEDREEEEEEEGPRRADNLSTLVQHLRQGGEKRRTEEMKLLQGEGGPLDICLVTSSTNTQVTITPATHTPSTLRPPKVAQTPSHKPSVSEIPILYPGVVVLGDVDFSRLPSLLLQMADLMTGRARQATHHRDINPKHLQRLEFEAQLLREAEPFYISNSLPWCPSTSPWSPQVCGPTLTDAPIPSVLARIVAELSDCKIAGESVLPQDRRRLQVSPSDDRLARLLQEAQELV